MGERAQKQFRDAVAHFINVKPLGYDAAQLEPIRSHSMELAPEHMPPAFDGSDNPPDFVDERRRAGAEEEN